MHSIVSNYWLSLHTSLPMGHITVTELSYQLWEQYVNILILNRFRIATHNYREWLGPDVRLTLITERSAFEEDEDTAQSQMRSYNDVVILEDYAKSWPVEYCAFQLHGSSPFDTIIALSEYDLLRAARLRELFQINGQSVPSTLAYRDKYLMKEMLKAAGLPTVTYAPVEHMTDILAFSEKHGFPLIVKPRRGGSSIGVIALRSSKDLEEFTRTYALPSGDEPADLLVECYLEHRLFNIDGIYFNDAPLLWPSQTTTNLNFLSGERLVSTMLPANHSLFDGLCRIVRQATNVLPTPEGSIIHAEVFLSLDGTLFLNEIACRMGGAGIRDTIKAAFGVDLVEISVKNDLSIPVLTSLFARGPSLLAGWVSFPPKLGELVYLPETCPLDGVIDYRTDAKAGTKFTKISDCDLQVASMVAISDSQEGVETILDKAFEWFDQKTLYA